MVDGAVGLAGHGDAILDTPLGPVRLTWANGAVQGVDLEPDAATPDGGGVPGAVLAELAAYFDDGGHRFTLPLGPAGTPFQRRVWEALRAIPPGRTRSYGDLAAELGTSPRAIGGACRANPCPILIPCHRVVGAAGLGGFAGDTSGRRLAVKRWLLRHEGVQHPA
jgi:methylated-DNA-[protein]-cysteine S-methyltransferase